MTEPAPDIGPAPLLAAGRLLAEHGVYGLAWLDPDLIVAARYGRLAERLEVGEPVTRALPMLYGYEDVLTALCERKDETFSLPAVKLITPDGEAPRFNLTAFADRDRPGLIVLLGRVMAANDAETELMRQMRARLMVEEEVARKSRELAAANAELELANRDLEDYAAVISHDLKSPLRAMRHIADDVAEAISAGDQAGAHHALESLRTQSRRMSTMLSALLDYASVGRKADVVETVDTRSLVARIAESLERPPSFEIEIRGTWPVIETLAVPLDLVVRNLLDNAIKHHDRCDGRVVVAVLAGGAETAPFFRFSIADDGPGIDPRHHEAVLLPFRTLADTNGSGSSGMGLAFVKRTIETLGGRIRLRSDPVCNRGTTFEVWWPLFAASQAEKRSNSGGPTR